MPVMPFPTRRSQKDEFVSSGSAQWRARQAARISGGLVNSETCCIASRDLKGRRVFHRLESGYCAAGWQRRGSYPQRKWLSKPRRNLVGLTRARLEHRPGWIDLKDNAMELEDLTCGAPPRQTGYRGSVRRSQL